MLTVILNEFWLPHLTISSWTWFAGKNTTRHNQHLLISTQTNYREVKPKESLIRQYMSVWPTYRGGGWRLICRVIVAHCKTASQYSIICDSLNVEFLLMIHIKSKFKEWYISNQTYQKIIRMCCKKRMQKIFMVYETIGFYFIWKWYLNKRTHACKIAPKPKYIHFCKVKNKCYRSVANSLKHVSFRELFYNLITEASNYTYRLHIYNPYYRSLKIEIEIGTPDS